jgi:26S proteasome regulatory subunit N2
MYAVALAYRGTANNAAVRRLLHFAVSDVSDDVRRAAVLSLGLVLYQTPEQVRALIHINPDPFAPRRKEDPLAQDDPFQT